MERGDRMCLTCVSQRQQHPGELLSETVAISGGGGVGQNCFADFALSTCLWCMWWCAVSHSAGWRRSHTGYSTTFLLLCYCDKRSVCVCVYMTGRGGEKERQAHTQHPEICSHVFFFCLFPEIQECHFPPQNATCNQKSSLKQFFSIRKCLVFLSSKCCSSQQQQTFPLPMCGLFFLFYLFLIEQLSEGGAGGVFPTEPRRQTSPRTHLTTSFI